MVEAPFIQMAMKEGSMLVSECKNWCVQQHFNHDMQFVILFYVALLLMCGYQFIKIAYDNLNFSDEKKEQVASALIDGAWYLLIAGTVMYTLMRHGLI